MKSWTRIANFWVANNIFNCILDRLNSNTNTYTPQIYIYRWWPWHFAIGIPYLSLRQDLSAQITIWKICSSIIHLLKYLFKETWGNDLSGTRKLHANRQLHYQQQDVFLLLFYINSSSIFAIFLVYHIPLRKPSISFYGYYISWPRNSAQRSL